MLTISQLQYCEPTNTCILMQVTLDEDTAGRYHKAGDTIPFTYNPADDQPVSVAVRALLDHGDYEIQPYVEPTEPVPASVSRRQLLIGLTTAGLITQSEAVAAASTGAVPAAVQAVFDTMPTDQKVAAEITWAAMSQADRTNPLVGALAQARGLTDEQVDDLFRAMVKI